MEIDINAAAAQIAKDVFEIGSVGRSPAKRMQFLGGRYPDDEKPQGGVCETALAELIKTSLKKQLAASRDADRPEGRGTVNVPMLEIALQRLEGCQPPSAHHDRVVVEVPTRLDYLSDSRPVLPGSSAAPENTTRQMQAVKFKAERYCVEGECRWEWGLDA